MKISIWMAAVAVGMSLGQATLRAEPVSPEDAPRQPDPYEDSTANDVLVPEEYRDPNVGAAKPAPEEALGVTELFLYFASGDSRLDDRALARLDEIVSWLGQDADRMVYVIEDENGTGTEDLTLTHGRADAIRSYLLSRGISPIRVRILAVGDAVPPATWTSPKHGFVFFGSASAKEEPEPIRPPEPGSLQPPSATEPASEPPGGTYYYDAPLPVVPYPPSGYGMGVSIGGGVVGFIDDDMRDLSMVGGSWEARATFGTRREIAFEAAYVGTVQNMDALGLDSSAVLISNGIESDVRVNLVNESLVLPYFFGGVGWSRFQIVNDDFNDSVLEDLEDITYVPAGVGLGLQLEQGLFLDVRGLVRFAFNDDIIRESSIREQPRTTMDSWNLCARAGWEF